MNEPYDEFAPPGMLTARGDNISIDRNGVLYLQRGRSVSLVMLAPLQWQLAAVAFERLANSHQRGPICLSTLKQEHELQIARGERGERLVSIWNPLTRYRTTVPLRASEVPLFVAACRARSPQPNTQQKEDTSHVN